MNKETEIKDTSEFNLSEKRKQQREDIKYLFSKIDWGNSFLDAKAIGIMNSFWKDITDSDKEAVRLLKERLIFITEYVRMEEEIDKIFGSKLI